MCTRGESLSHIFGIISKVLIFLLLWMLEISKLTLFEIHFDVNQMRGVKWRVYDLTHETYIQYIVHATNIQSFINTIGSENMLVLLFTSQLNQIATCCWTKRTVIKLLCTVQTGTVRFHCFSHFQKQMIILRT